MFYDRRREVVAMGRFSTVKNRKRGSLTAVDLFSGSGAVTLGLKEAGYDVLAAVDIDEVAGETYRANHPEVDLRLRDITVIRPSIDFVSLPGKIDLLAVCAPCQPFSTRNKNRFNEDTRVALVLQSIKFAKRFEPAVVFFENVPGIERHPIFERLTRELKKLHYHLGEAKTIDAADLGVPQRRPRMVLVAAKKQSLLERVNDFGSFTTRTVHQAISDLSVPMVGRHSNKKDPLHFSRKHHAITLERLKHIPINGGSRYSLPTRLVLKCHQNLSINQSPDTYGRMCWDDVAPTLTTGCTDLTKGRYAHPEQNRAITLREAARLQTFPDSYSFIGNPTQISSQIGNAVPPRMMTRIALRIARSL